MANVKSFRVVSEIPLELEVKKIGANGVPTGDKLDDVDGVFRNPAVTSRISMSSDDYLRYINEARTAWNDGVYIISYFAIGGILPLYAEEIQIINDDIYDPASAAAIYGSGDTAVNHDTGGSDNLRFVTALNVGIDNADIKAYLKSDYDAGNLSEIYVKARTITDINGRWEHSIYLDSGNTYTIVAYKQGAYDPASKEISI